MKNIQFLIALFCSFHLLANNLNEKGLKHSFNHEYSAFFKVKLKPNAMTVKINTDTICSGGSTTMKAVITGSIGSFKYVWTVPSGMTNPGDVRSFKTSTVGNYAVEVTNLNTLEVANGSGKVTLSGLPNASGVISTYCGSYDATNKTRYLDWSPNIAGIVDWHYSYSVNGGSNIMIAQQGGKTSFDAPSPNSTDFIQMVLYPKGTVCHQKLEWACPSYNPVINAVSEKMGCSGNVFNKIDFTTSANSTYYDGVIWTNDNPSIGLASSGNTMYIPSFTAASVTQPVTATISVVLTKFGTEVWNGSGKPSAPITFKITINPLPTPQISLIGNTLKSSSTVGNQWYDKNGVILGATNQDFVPTSNGEYYVIVKENNCLSEKSNSIVISTLATLDYEMDKKVYLTPNPVSEILTIISESNEFMNANIYDTSGRCLHSTMLQNGTINVSSLPSGVYFLELEGTINNIYKTQFIKL